MWFRLLLPKWRNDYSLSNVSAKKVLAIENSADVGHDGLGIVDEEAVVDEQGEGGAVYFFASQGTFDEFGWIFGGWFVVEVDFFVGEIEIGD